MAGVPVSEPATFAAMRHHFQHEPELQITPIEKIRLPLKSRDELPPLLAGLQWGWMHPTLKTKILALLEAKILAGKKATGRTGMDLWQILVLGVVRLGLDADWDRIVELNLTSCMRLTRAIVPQMKQRNWGRIIHISSVMGLTSKPGRSSYSATKSALITGITGQDGSYLAELLLSKGYEVTGVVRRSSAPNYWRIEHLLDRVSLRPADLLDQLSLMRLVQDVQPDEFYNLAAMSFVPASWDQPMLTGEFNAQGVTRALEAVRQVDPSIRIYQASSSEMFGKVREVPQRESTPFYPRSPYGVSKVFAHYITVNYRESYNLFAVSGITFNHESPLRPELFVTQKIVRGAARIARGTLDLDLPERKVILDDAGQVAAIAPRPRLDSHRLIEEFMVLANVAAAQALEHRQMPCMYRVHDQPDLAKLEALREFLGTLGIPLPAGPGPDRGRGRQASKEREASRQLRLHSHFRPGG